MDKINKINNWSNPIEIKRIQSKWKFGKIDICISTYNRLPYLQKCINSILASSRMLGKIIVSDDGSDDGSKEWLTQMLDRNKIDIVNFNNRLGTPVALNTAVDKSESNIIVVCNDDMYFHRYWDFSVMDTFLRAEGCGLVTFYDYSRVNCDQTLEKTDPNFSYIIRSGMGCTAIKRGIFDTVKGFQLPPNKKMGYFASGFCEKVNSLHLKCKGSKHYITIPNYSVHIDHPQNKLCDRDILTDYCNFRTKNKKGKVNYDYLTDFDLSRIKQL